MIGLLGGDPDAPATHGGDPTGAASSGFGLSGIGDGSGTGEGIGLGSVGTLGHSGTGTGQGFGSGHGRLGGSRAAPPKVRTSGASVSGRLPPEVIQRIVRQNFGRFRMCYEQALRRDPTLEGRVVVRFVIGRDGSVTNVSAGGDFPDPSVPNCVAKAFYGLTFPQPEGGIVSVSYPIVFSPGDAPASPAASASAATASVSAEPDASASASASRATEPDASASAAAVKSAGTNATDGRTAAPPAIADLGARPGEDELPIVVVADGLLLVDRDVAGSTRPVVDLSRVMKIDALYDLLKARRERYLEAHPAGRPGVCGLRLAPDTSLLVAKSVFQTIAYAGYPTILVQIADHPETMFALEAQLPGPPSGGESPAPAAVLHAHVLADAIELRWTRGADVVGESKWPLPVHGLALALCAEQRQLGSHKDPTDGARDELVVHAPNEARLESLLPLLTAAAECRRDGPGSAKMPAFFATFSIR